jgi:hypothetical protein
MRLKALIEYLQKFDENSEVEFADLMDYYDIIFLNVSTESNGKVSINIKVNYKVDDDGEKYTH